MVVYLIHLGLGWWFMAITVFACFVVVTAMLATYVAKGSADKDNRRRGKSEPSADTGEAADQGTETVRMRERFLRLA